MTTENAAIARKNNDQIDWRESMETKNTQKQEMVLLTDFNNSKIKDENVVVGDFVVLLEVPTEAHNQRDGVPEESQIYDHLIKEDVLLVGLQELQKVEKENCVSLCGRQAFEQKLSLHKWHRDNMTVAPRHRRSRLTHILPNYDGGSRRLSILILTLNWCLKKVRKKIKILSP